MRLLLHFSAFGLDELARTALEVARAMDQTVVGDLSEAAAAIAALELSYLESANLDDEMFDEDAEDVDMPVPYPGPTRKQNGGSLKPPGRFSTAASAAPAGNRVLTT